MPSTATLNYTFTTSNPSPSIFRVNFAVTSQVGFPDTKVFIIRSSDDQLDRVASVGDIANWPSTKDTSIEFYRASSVDKDYGSPSTGTRGMDVVEAELLRLAEDYATFLDTFVSRSGSATYTT